MDEWSERIPADAPAIVFHGSTELATLNIVGARFDGQPTVTLTLAPERSPSSRLALLGAELTPNSEYTIQVDATCSSEQATSLPITSTATIIHTGPPSALPTTLGTIAVGAQEEQYPGLEAELATKVTLSQTAEVTAYLKVMRFDLYENGEPWGEIPYGDMRPERSVRPGTETSLALRLTSGCAASMTCGTRRICRGDTGTASLRRFELRGHVAGAGTDPPPVAFEAPIDCSFERRPEESGCQIAFATGSGSQGPALGATAAWLLALVGVARRRTQR